MESVCDRKVCAPHRFWDGGAWREVASWFSVLCFTQALPNRGFFLKNVKQLCDPGEVPGLLSWAVDDGIFPEERHRGCDAPRRHCWAGPPLQRLMQFQTGEPHIPWGNRLFHIISSNFCHYSAEKFHAFPGLGMFFLFINLFINISIYLLIMAFIY